MDTKEIGKQLAFLVVTIIGAFGAIAFLTGYGVGLSDQSLIGATAFTGACIIVSPLLYLTVDRIL